MGVGRSDWRDDAAGVSDHRASYIADDPEDLTYIDTVFMLSGLVWHVFELDQQP